jgi:predicted house-cleaning noncanonical NTP pyrophosphatase (MazG superfamily)
MADFQGVSKDEIEIARLKKLDERGGFKKCLVLKD